MKIKLFFMIIFVISIAILLVACNFLGDIFNSNSDDIGTDDNGNIEEELVDDTEISSDVYNSNGTADEEGRGIDIDKDGGGFDADGPLIIEIHEDRIIFRGNEISLAELEEILRQHNNPEYIWELHDIYQAVKSVYDAVVELLNEHNIVFRENNTTNEPFNQR